MHRPGVSVLLLGAALPMTWLTEVDKTWVRKPWGLYRALKWLTLLWLRALRLLETPYMKSASGLFQLAPFLTHQIISLCVQIQFKTITFTLCWKTFPEQLYNVICTREPINVIHSMSHNLKSLISLRKFSQVEPNLFFNVSTQSQTIFLHCESKISVNWEIFSQSPRCY